MDGHSGREPAGGGSEPAGGGSEPAGGAGDQAAAADGSAEVAASLAAWIDGLSFADLGAEEVTAFLVDAVVAWGTGQGWRVYRRAASVLSLPPPYQHRRSCVDVACARPAAPPVVVEVDRSDRRRSVEKLLAEAAAGRIALWVRWGAGTLAVPPAPVQMVACPVTTRPGPGGRGRLHSHRPADNRPAPRHTVRTVPAARTGLQQAELFTGDPAGQASSVTSSAPSA